MVSIAHEIVGGTVGGVLGMSIVYPLDTIKSSHIINGGSSCGDVVSARRAYEEGMFSSAFILGLCNSAAVFSLYRGLLSPVVGYGALFAISFSSYGFACRYLVRRRGADRDIPLSPSERAIAGAWSGLLNAPLRQVFERVKSVMQVRAGLEGASPYSWSGACAVDLVKKEGFVMGLGRGMVSTAIREPLQFAIYYPTYEWVKSKLTPVPADNEGPRPDPVWALLMAGGIAGSATWMPPVYFIDMMKTRMQTAEPGVYSGLRDCVAKTLRAEGVPFFFRGLGPSLLRAFPLHALIFLGFETTVSFLQGTPSPTFLASAVDNGVNAEEAATAMPPSSQPSTATPEPPFGRSPTNVKINDTG